MCNSGKENFYLLSAGKRGDMNGRCSGEEIIMHKGQIVSSAV